MKGFFWTTVFWLIVFAGFAFYLKMFNPNMAVGVTTWLGVTVSSTTGDNVPTSGDILVVSGAQSDVMSGITAIQTTLADMQIKINTLVGGITVADVAT